MKKFTQQSLSFAAFVADADAVDEEAKAPKTRVRVPQHDSDDGDDGPDLKKARVGAPLATPSRFVQTQTLFVDSDDEVAPAVAPFVPDVPDNGDPEEDDEEDEAETVPQDDQPASESAGCGCPPVSIAPARPTICPVVRSAAGDAGKKAAAPAKKKVYKKCSVEECDKDAKKGGLCIAHGGGKRCQGDGCEKTAQGTTDFCKAHGGGKRCQAGGCTKSAQGVTDFCAAHGGGKQCSVEKCGKLARPGGLCVTHGGGKRCNANGCTKGAQSNSGFCRAHGGGRRCKTEGCCKSAQGVTDFCRAHGGGPRCKVDGCTKGALEPTDFCSAHGGGKRCKVEGCTRGAAEAKDFCVRHGGGTRCATGACAHLHDGVPAYAQYKLSANASLKGADGATYPKPEMAGTPVCMYCLKRMDPTHEGVRTHVRKEHLVVGAIAQELIERGEGALVSLTEGNIVHDCATGASRRRADLDLLFRARLATIFENDEGQHGTYTTSCEHRKIAGHLVDKGATGMTHAEAALWDESLPGDLELEAMRDTPRDTPEMQKLRRDRQRANQRMVREISAKGRAVARDADDAANLKIHVVRFNCDEYVTDKGVKVGSLFKATTVRSSANDDIKVEPTEQFAPAIKRLVDHLLTLRDIANDDERFASHKTWQVDFLRYDGCDADGWAVAP